MNLIETIIMPPASPIILIFIGLFLIRRKYLAKFVIFIGLMIIYVFSTPFFAHKLINKVDIYPVVDVNDAKKAEAIVVLTAGIKYADEFKSYVNGKNSLVKARYAAFLHKLTNLPILIVGGSSNYEEVSEAKTMAIFLRQLGVTTSWIEEKAKNTFESAKNVKKILAKDYVNKILLISNAYHLKRSVIEFKKQGFDVIPAPTSKLNIPKLGIKSFIPSTQGLNVSRTALHEILGIYYYKLLNKFLNE